MVYIKKVLAECLLNIVGFKGSRVFRVSRHTKIFFMDNYKTHLRRYEIDTVNALAQVLPVEICFQVARWRILKIARVCRKIACQLAGVYPRPMDTTMGVHGWSVDLSNYSLVYGYKRGECCMYHKVDYVNFNDYPFVCKRQEWTGPLYVKCEDGRWW